MTAHNPDEFQWANTFWECFEQSHKSGLLEIMRSIIRSAVSVAVATERERCAVIAEIAATHALGDPCRIIAKRIRIDPAIGESPRTEPGVTP